MLYSENFGLGRTSKKNLAEKSCREQILTDFASMSGAMKKKFYSICTTTNLIITSSPLNLKLTILKKVLH